MFDERVDYVIVGAGTAGCVLAARLSVDPHVRVSLLESGGMDTNPAIYDQGLNAMFSLSPLEDCVVLCWGSMCLRLRLMNFMACVWCNWMEELSHPSNFNSMM